MNHAETVSRGALEKYVLGELPAPELEEFEQHFFDCPECASDLYIYAILEDNARAVFREQQFRATNATHWHRHR